MDISKKLVEAVAAARATLGAAVEYIQFSPEALMRFLGEKQVAFSVRERMEKDPRRRPGGRFIGTQFEKGPADSLRRDIIFGDLVVPDDPDHPFYLRWSARTSPAGAEVVFSPLVYRGGRGEPVSAHQEIEAYLTGLCQPVVASLPEEVVEMPTPSWVGATATEPCNCCSGAAVTTTLLCFRSETEELWREFVSHPPTPAEAGEIISF